MLSSYDQFEIYFGLHIIYINVIKIFSNLLTKVYVKGVHYH